MRLVALTFFAALAAAAVLSLDQLLVTGPRALKGPSVQAEIPGNTPLETCRDDEAQLVEIAELLVEPFPPVPGENMTVAAKGTLRVAITDGAYVDVLVRYGFITLVNRRYDLCELLPEVDLECPVPAGFLSLSRSIEVPENVPPGEYSVEVQAYTADDELLTCVQGVIDLNG